MRRRAQQVMVSAFHQESPRWAVLGSVGWQQWSKFGKVEVGLDSSNPTSHTTDLDYDDTWHVALGGRGNRVGSYPETGMFFMAFSFRWVF